MNHVFDRDPQYYPFTAYSVSDKSLKWLHVDLSAVCSYEIVCIIKSGVSTRSVSLISTLSFLTTSFYDEIIYQLFYLIESFLFCCFFLTYRDHVCFREQKNQNFNTSSQQCQQFTLLLTRNTDQRFVWLRTTCCCVDQILNDWIFSWLIGGIVFHAGPLLWAHLKQFQIPVSIHGDDWRTPSSSRYVSIYVGYS